MLVSKLVKLAPATLTSDSINLQNKKDWEIKVDLHDRKHKQRFWKGDISQQKISQMWRISKNDNLSIIYFYRIKFWEET